MSASDDELRRQVRYAAQLHGVTPQEVVAEVAGEEPAEGLEPAAVPAGVSKRRGRRISLLAAMVSVGVMVGLVIVGVMKFVNDPVEAAATAKGLVKPPVSVKPTPTTSVLSGLYVSMNYPGIFDQLQHMKTDVQSLEQYMLSSKSNYRRTIAVDVRPLVSGGVEDDASYKLRLLHADQYRPSTDKVAGEPVAIMTKLDGREQTLFWAHQGKLLIVSITSSDTMDDVAAFMNVVKPTIRWRS
jgi:hypothetical protein